VKPANLTTVVLFPKEFPPVTKGVLLFEDRLLITGHENGFVVQWDLGSDKYIILARYASPIRALSVSGGRNVVVGCLSGLLVAFSLSSPQNVEVISPAANNVYSRIWTVSHVNDTDFVFTSTYGEVSIARRREGSWTKERLQCNHRDSIFGLSKLNGEFFASGDYRGNVIFWQFSGDGLQVIDEAIATPYSSVEDIVWRKDNASATISSNGHICYFETSSFSSWRMVLDTDLARSAGKCIHMTEDGNTIFGGTATEIIQLDIDSQQANLVDISETKAIFSKSNTIYALTSAGLFSFEKSPIQVLLDQVKYQYAKISLIGRTSTGKTTLCSRIVSGSVQDIKSTFGKRIWNWNITKEVDVPERRVIFHDHGGQETVLDTFLPFLTDSDIILLFFKKTDLESFYFQKGPRCSSLRLSLTKTLMRLTMLWFVA